MIPKRVLVAGGKGGVGKSTVAVNLSLCAARDGARVLLVDLDLGLGDVPMLLGMEVERDFAAFLRGEEAIRDVLSQAPEGLACLVARQGDAQLASGSEVVRERLLRGLDELEPEFDLIVCDAPAGIGPDVLAYSRAAHRTLIVTTPEPPAMTDAYGFVKAMDQEAERLGIDLPTPELFVNQVADRGEARRTAQHLAQVARRFLARSPREAGWMPRARAVVRAVAERTPFVLCEQNSLAARSIARLRDHVLKEAKAIV